MELTHQFKVAVPPAQAWAVLTDVERIAPCLPGAQLQEVEGEEYRGVVKVKVGPITAQYKGKATFLEQDEAGGRLVLRCEGRDTRGQGNANATITASLAADGEGTKVDVVTDLTVTGKVAQFGRGVMADVSAKLLDQFVSCLETKVIAGTAGGEGAAPTPAPSAPASGTGPAAPSPAAPTAAATTAAAPTAAATATATEPAPAGEAPDPVTAATNGTAPAGVRRIDHPESAPVDLFETAGGSVAKRLVPVLAALAALFALVRWRRRGR